MPLWPIENLRPLKAGPLGVPDSDCDRKARPLVPCPGPAAADGIDADVPLEAATDELELEPLPNWLIASANPAMASRISSGALTALEGIRSRRRRPSGRERFGRDPRPKPRAAVAERRR